jgi:hypothetical protein
MTITTTQSFNTRALPAAGSLMRALDTVNFFVAASVAGFGPFVAVFLGEQNWSQEEIGFLLSAGAAESMQRAGSVHRYRPRFRSAAQAPVVHP